MGHGVKEVEVVGEDGYERQMRKKIADGCAPPPAFHILGHKSYPFLDGGIHEEGVEELEVKLKKK